MQLLVDSFLKVEIWILESFFDDEQKTLICLHKYEYDNMGELSIDRNRALIYHLIMKTLSIQYYIGR